MLAPSSWSTVAIRPPAVGNKPWLRSVLEVAEYNPEWPQAFEQEARQLQWLLGQLAVRVDHVGSTAVAGLAAQPVIDIQVSVASLQPHERFDALAVRGYVRVPLGGDDVYQPFFQRPARWPSEYHVHLCLVGSVEERARYARAKAPVIAAVLRRALEEGYPRG